MKHISIDGRRQFRFHIKDNNIQDIKDGNNNVIDKVLPLPQCKARPFGTRSIEASVGQTAGGC